MKCEFCGYIVYDDGRVYAPYLKRFLKVSTGKNGYKQVTLRTPEQKNMETS